MRGLPITCNSTRGGPFFLDQDRCGRPPRCLSNWNGDGIVARIETDEIATALKRTGLPVVDVSAARQLKNIPWVETDDHAIARLAVQRLEERGFHNFGFMVIVLSIWRFGESITLCAWFLRQGKVLRL